MSQANGVGCGVVESLAFWAKHLDKPTFVYVIQGDPGTPVKIGRAVDVMARMRGLQTGNPSQLRLLAVIPDIFGEPDEDDERYPEDSLEWQLHQRFKDCRLQGEWFTDCEAVISTVTALATRLRETYEAGETISLHDLADGFILWRTFGRSGPVTIRHMKPDPVPPDVAMERLKAHWMRRSRPGDRSGYSVKPDSGTIN